MLVAESGVGAGAALPLACRARDARDCDKPDTLGALAALLPAGLAPLAESLASVGKSAPCESRDCPRLATPLRSLDAPLAPAAPGALGESGAPLGLATKPSTPSFKSLRLVMRVVLVSRSVRYSNTWLVSFSSERSTRSRSPVALKLMGSSDQCSG